MTPIQQADRELVLAAVAQDGAALEWASEELQGEVDVVLAAVKTFGLALQWAWGYLRDDDEVVLEAVQQVAVKEQLYSFAEQQSE